MGWTSANGGNVRPIGVVLVLAASAAWATGSLLAPRLALPRDPVIGLAVQLAAAGLALGAIVTASGITATTHLARVPLAAWGALAFLTVASTLVGYAVFLELNARVSPTLANTFNYAAPVIALVLSAAAARIPDPPEAGIGRGRLDRRRPDDRSRDARCGSADHNGDGSMMDGLLTFGADHGARHEPCATVR